MYPICWRTASINWVHLLNLPFHMFYESRMVFYAYQPVVRVGFYAMHGAGICTIKTTYISKNNLEAKLDPFRNVVIP